MRAASLVARAFVRCLFRVCLAVARFMVRCSVCVEGVTRRIDLTHTTDSVHTPCHFVRVGATQHNPRRRSLTFVCAGKIPARRWPPTGLVWRKVCGINLTREEKVPLDPTDAHPTMDTPHCVTCAAPAPGGVLCVACPTKAALCGRSCWQAHVTSTHSAPGLTSGVMLEEDSAKIVSDAYVPLMEMDEDIYKLTPVRPVFVANLGMAGAGKSTFESTLLRPPGDDVATPPSMKAKQAEERKTALDELKKALDPTGRIRPDNTYPINVDAFMKALPGFETDRKDQAATDVLIAESKRRILEISGQEPPDSPADIDDFVKKELPRILEPLVRELLKKEAKELAQLTAKYPEGSSGVYFSYRGTAGNAGSAGATALALTQRVNVIWESIGASPGVVAFFIDKAHREGYDVWIVNTITSNVEIGKRLKLRTTQRNLMPTDETVEKIKMSMQVLTPLAERTIIIDNDTHKPKVVYDVHMSSTFWKVHEARVTVDEDHGVSVAARVAMNNVKKAVEAATKL